MTINAWQQFLNNWRHQPAMQMATLSVLVGAFTVLAVALLFQQNLESVLTQWGNKVRVNVYLNEEADDQQTSNISKFIEKSQLFDSVNYLSKSQAVTKFRERIGNYAPGLLTDLEFDNPLPASFELEMEGGVSSRWSYRDLVQFAENVKKQIGVDEVSYGQGWVENYASALKVFSITSWGFLMVLLSGTLFVIGNSIRNTISQRRDEIEILELFGATRALIIWPFVFEGLVMGLIASSLALIASYLLYVWQLDFFTKDLSFWNVHNQIQYLTVWRAALVLIIGMAMGGLGSFIWARKVSTGWAAAEATVK